MPYLLQAAFWVGVIGAVVALPLLCVLRFRPSYLSTEAFQLSSPVVLFFSAALAFASIYTLLPSTRWRTRIAGMIAGIVTYFVFGLWMTFVADVDVGLFDRASGILYSFALMFVLAGWIPLGGGWIAGWAVSRLPDTPPEEAA